MSASDQYHLRRDPALAFIRETAQSFVDACGLVGASAGADEPGTAPDLSAIDRLCEWSFSPEPAKAKAATAAIFGGVIETLCDDFSDRGVTISAQVLTRILQFIRTMPQGAELDLRLNDWGFADGEAILRRYQAISQTAPLGLEEVRRVRKVLVLSRVTAGADIAITSVIVNRLCQHFPSAELVLIGPGHLAEIFAQVANCRHRNFVYKNDGSLFEKMTSWPRLLAVADDERQGFGSDEVLLFDPDTRLTQLGLLPLAPDERTCYFPSRLSRQGELTTLNLSALTNHWLNLLFGETLAVRPSLLFPRNGEGYHSFCQALHGQGCRLIVTVNFGVGRDPRKRVHGPFEDELIRALLRIPDTVVILDTGRGELKEEWIQGYLALAASGGWPAARLTDRELKERAIAFGHGLVVFTGALGSLGKMIDAADCFIGYDSCGQHLAAATRTPAAIVFAGAPSARFIHRWSPDTPGNLTIPVSGPTASAEAIGHLIHQITQAVETILAKQTRLSTP